MSEKIDYITPEMLGVNFDLLSEIPCAPHFVSNKLLRKKLGWTFAKMNYQIGKLLDQGRITHLKHGRIHYYQRVEAHEREGC